MIRLLKKVFIVFTAILLISFNTYFVAIALPEDGEEELLVDGNPVTSKAAIVIDHATGLVILEYNADELRVPASMTKMIAVYVVFDAINDGIINFDTVFEITGEASSFSYVRAFSNVPMPRGSAYTVRELLSVVISRSASAATISLGEGLFGSEEALVAKMNEKMNLLGIEAEFSDSWGGSPENRISARGMVEFTRLFIKEYPEILEFSSKESVFFDEIEYRSTNPLLTSYVGVDGFKTGYTRPAGWCFTGTASVDGRRIIAVTMGSEQGNRFPDTEILLDYGFSYYNLTIAKHFRGAMSYNLDSFHLTGTPLVPISEFNIYESKHINIRDLAILLNETEKND